MVHFEVERRGQRRRAKGEQGAVKEKLIKNLYSVTNFKSILSMTEIHEIQFTKFSLPEQETQTHEDKPNSTTSINGKDLIFLISLPKNPKKHHQNPVRNFLNLKTNLGN